MPYDPHYLEGVRYFNDCEFFEAHEAWEELWTDYHGPSRDFYKGLIHAAVCLHHFGNGNARGAKKLYGSCRGYLSKYLPRHEGLDVAAFLAGFEACCADLLAQPDDAGVEIVADIIPEIHLDPAA